MQSEVMLAIGVRLSLCKMPSFDRSQCEPSAGLPRSFVVSRGWLSLDRAERGERHLAPRSFAAPRGQFERCRESFTHDQPVFSWPLPMSGPSFALQATVIAPQGYWLRVHPPRGIGATIPISSFSAYQILSMPVDMNRAGYVRHTGKVAIGRSLPRALVAQPMEADGIVNLATLRNPVPTDPRLACRRSRAEPALIWFDVHVPKGTPPGEYAGEVDLMTANNPQTLMTVPIRLTVYDFELPDERHLQMVGQLGWDRLEKLYPSQFETVTPSWVNRREGRYQATVRTLDHLVALAKENRANLIVPSLKPIVKWPAGEGPQIDWGDFDSMVRPWFSGDAFTDHIGLGYWPMPEAELLNRYDRPSQLQYWTAAATHFDSHEWPGLTAVSLENPSPGRPGPAERGFVHTGGGDSQVQSRPARAASLGR